MIKNIKKLFNFFFHEVGIFTGYINYCINRVIHKNKYTGLKKKTNKKYQIFSHNKFNEYGWSKIKLSQSIKNKTLINLRNLKKNETSSNKTHWKELFKYEKNIKNYIANELLKTDIFDFALDYFNCIPILRSVNCFYTEGRDNLSLTSSLNWHKDLHHKKLIKIMYCVNEINEENGPTNFFNKKKSTNIKYVNYPNYFSDNDLKQQNHKFNYEQCLGLSGDAFMIDTAQCFHMGSRSKKDRLQIIITISPYASRLYPYKNVFIDQDLSDFNQLLYDKYKL